MATVTLLILVELMIYFFIDFVDGHNALVKLYKNATNMTFNDKRRLLRQCSEGTDITNFNSATNKLLSGVALISRKNISHNKWESHCTGSLVKNERNPSDTKYYVLTATHCFYEIKKAPKYKWVGEQHGVSYWRVEFHVTNEWRQTTHDIIQCDVKDIRINDKYTDGTTYHRRYDYAIMTLGGSNCHPNHAFKLDTFTIADQDKLHRAGYRKTRTLKVVKHEQISHTQSLHQNWHRQGILRGLFVTRGCQDMGDSGGPHYVQKGAKLHQTAIVGGTMAKGNNPEETREYYGVKINNNIKTKIFDLMDGHYGISILVKKCDTSNTNNECWSKCTNPNYKQKICFHSRGSMVRDFHENNKKLKCRDGSPAHFRYLCGKIEPINSCSSSQSNYRVKCLTTCNQRCPNGRSSLHQILSGCSRGRAKKICSQKSAHIMEIDHYYYDDDDDDDDDDYYNDRY